MLILSGSFPWGETGVVERGGAFPTLSFFPSYAIFSLPLGRALGQPITILPLPHNICFSQLLSTSSNLKLNEYASLVKFFKSPHVTPYDGAGIKGWW